MKYINSVTCKLSRSQGLEITDANVPVKMYDDHISLNSTLSPSKFGSSWASTQGQRTTAPQPGDYIRLQRKSQRSLHRIRFIWLLRMLGTQLDFMMNFIENEFHWIRNCYACFEHNSTSWWTSLKNEFRWIRETRSLRTMCVKVITMTLRILLLWLAAGALRGTRTYPNTFDSTRTLKRLM